MKGDDLFHNALLSLHEVACFAFSVVELLLIRILPLTGYLLFHLCRILASSVFASFRGWRTSRRPSTSADQTSSEPADHASWQAANISTEDQVAEYLDNQLQSRDAFTATQGWTSSPNAQPSAPPLESVIADGNMEVEEEKLMKAEGSSTKPGNLSEMAGDNGHSLATEDMSNSSEVKMDQLPVIGETQSDVSADEVGKTAESPTSMYMTSSSYATAPDQLGDSIVSKGTASRANMESAIDMEKSDTSTTVISSNLPRRRMPVRVLPPSWSQVKRSLMRRSRRSSPAAIAASNLNADGRPLSPAIATNLNRATAYSPGKMRRKSRRMTKASSSSYDNFMRKFKTHFQVDSSPSPESPQTSAPEDV